MTLTRTAVVLLVSLFVLVLVQVEPDAAADPPVSYELVPNADTYVNNWWACAGTSPLYTKIDEGLTLDTECSTSTTPSSMYMTSGYSAAFSDLPAGTTGTYSVSMDVHITAGHSPYVQLKNDSATLAQQTDIAAGFNGWVDLETFGLTAAQVNNLRLSAGQGWSSNWHTRINSAVLTATKTNYSPDPTAPDVHIGGELIEDLHDPLTGDVYELWVDAVDGTDASPQAGVRSIEIAVKRDGASGFEQAHYVEQPCPDGNCEMETAWEFQRGSFGVGRHEVRVAVRDWSGNLHSESVLVDVSTNQTEAPTETETEIEPPMDGDFSSADGCKTSGGYPASAVAGTSHADRGFAGNETTIEFTDGSYEVTHCNFLGRLVELTGPRSSVHPV